MNFPFFWIATLYCRHQKCLLFNNHWMAWMTELERVSDKLAVVNFLLTSNCVPVFQWQFRIECERYHAQRSKLVFCAWQSKVSNCQLIWLWTVSTRHHWIKKGLQLLWCCYLIPKAQVFSDCIESRTVVPTHNLQKLFTYSQ